MAAKPTARTAAQVTGKPAASTEAVKQITYLATALKAPRITEAAARLPGASVDPIWLAYMLRLLTLGQYSMTAAQPGIGIGQIRPLALPLPGLEEQRMIATYLDEQTAKIEMLIAETERFIELARERRSALITAAVTGEIDVRAVA
jgi:restriction endonuclease S subunit